MNRNPAVLLSTAFLAPVQYYSKLTQYEAVYIEYFENYSKQSYRNRCTVLSSNGPLNLSIPVEKGSGLKTLIKEVRIDNNSRWKQIHLRAFEAAYRSSPYYLYYADEIFSAYNKNYTFLIDFNNEMLKITMELLGIDKVIKHTYAYKNIAPGFDDYSDSIHPKNRMKKPDKSFNPVDYYQVFESKFGFIPNLSIADLLFNMGPESLETIKKSVIKI
jgi:hypothetical protein